MGGRAHRLGATGDLRALELRAGDSALGTELRAALHFPSVTALPVVPRFVLRAGAELSVQAAWDHWAQTQTIRVAAVDFPLQGHGLPRNPGKEGGSLVSSAPAEPALACLRGVGMGPLFGCALASVPSGGCGCLARDGA